MKRILLPLALMASAAFANERHFTYTYETAVLPPGAKELEVWTTLRAGQEQYYSRLDQRMEFEAGVAPNLMTAFYLNWKQTTSRSAGTLNTAFDYEGISNEWKWKLSDPVADPVGFALYGEVGYSTSALEIEAKTLFDKKVGKWLFAYNLVGEGEFEAEGDEMELEEIEIENDLAASYEVSPHFGAGLELRNHSEIAKEPLAPGATGEAEMEFEHSALFLGPVVSYSTESWWVSFTLLTQLPALYKAEGGSMFVLDEHEHVNARLLFSFHI